jgi:hypothetical protein
LVIVVIFLLTRGGEGSDTGTTEAFVGGDLHSLVADPANPDRLFVGGHQAVAVSSDAGKTWSAVPTLRDADAMGWGFTGDTVWVSGHPGLNRSSDGGRTFTRANSGLPDTDLHAFGAGPSVLYGASPAVGLFASTDDGRTWTTRAGGAGRSFFGRILVDPADQDHLVAADARSGPVESRDGGRSWRSLGGPVGGATWVSWAGEGASVLVASGGKGAAISADGGASWNTLDLPAGVTVVEASRKDAQVLYAAGLSGTSARVWVSRDGGRRWATA